MGSFLSITKKYKMLLLASFVLVLLNFGIDYSFQYATDTYSTVNETGTWYHIIFSNGRPLKALIFWAFEVTRVPFGFVYHFSHFLAIIFLAIAVAVFAVMLQHYVSSSWLCVAISFMILANPFSIEFMLFEEMGLFMLIILLNVIAVWVTEKRWREKKTDGLAWDIAIIQICMWISVSLYQTGVLSYVVLMLPFIVIYSESVRDFWYKNLFVAAMMGIPLGCAYILAAFFLPVDRLDNNLDLVGKIKNFWNIFRFVTFEEFYNVGRGIFLAWIVVLLVAVVCGIMAMSMGITKHILAVIYIMVGCVVTSFLLYITGSSTVCWPRMIYTYGMLFGIVSIYLLYELGLSTFKSADVARALIIGLTVFIIFYDYIGFGKVFLERHRANQEDLYYAKIIGQRIEEYEQETGHAINTLCYYKDHHIAVFSEGFDKTMLSERAQASGWSRHNSIEIYLNRKFEQGESDPELQEMFSEKDWNMYSEEQLVFDGNKLHICVY